MIRHHTLTMTGSAQQLSAAIADALPLPIRTISLQPYAANAAVAYVGGPGVSSTSYGVRLEIPVTSIPPAPFVLGEFQTGWVKLEDLYVNGANGEKLSILVDYAN